MLVILSFALVLVAVVLLVLGLLTGSGLALIYTSMACSLAAGIVLYVAIRVGKPRVQEAAAGSPFADMAPPARAREERVERTPAATAPVREAEGTVAVLERPEPEEPEEPEEEVAEPPYTEELRIDEELEEEEEEEFFPIADYDDLSASEIMPLLPELYPEELDVVEERERSTKGRVTILNRIAELREELAGRGEEDVWAVADEGWKEAEAHAEPERAEVPAPTGGFPIPDYDDLTAGEVVAVLEELNEQQLRAVHDREAAGAGRVTVLKAVAQLLGEEPAEPAEPAPPPPPPPAKKAPAKRAPAKTAAAKKAAPKKAAPKKAATKAAAAKKAAPKKAATKAAAAKKAAPKAAATKTAATKTAATKTAATKTAATKKAAAKKSSRGG